MKYRLVIDNDVDMSEPWFVVQKFVENTPFYGAWERVDSGNEKYCRRIYERLLAGKEKFTVVEESA